MDEARLQNEQEHENNLDYDEMPSVLTSTRKEMMWWTDNHTNNSSLCALQENPPAYGGILHNPNFVRN